MRRELIKEPVIINYQVHSLLFKNRKISKANGVPESRPWSCLAEKLPNLRNRAIHDW
jgi:hypothetical protein